ncbi:hypothetical protein ES708_33505 [subsurface metagenome]
MAAMLFFVVVGRVVLCVLPIFVLGPAMQTACILIFGTKEKIFSEMVVPLVTILILSGLIIFQEPSHTILSSLMA